MSSYQQQRENVVGKTPRVIAVVVTFNRRELLPLTLTGIAQAERTPDVVVVVDNASTDGTDQYLRDLHYELPLDVISLQQNMGGAGGFTVGIDRALSRHDADLVWVMDDDTEPTERALSSLVRAWENYRGRNGEHPAFVASKVEWIDGRDHPMNTMRTKFGASKAEHLRAEKVGARPIRSASFVSVMMDAAVMRREGLPIADFFIWNDDFEYTTRLAHHRDAIATAESVVIHHTKTIGNTNFSPGPRFYNDVRNKLWMFTRRRTLSPLEKTLYGFSVARLWVTTLVRTEEKKTYATYLGRGIRDALTSFRTNDQVLAGIYELELPLQSQRQIDSAESKYAEKLHDFSVLMCTYAGDSAEYLNQAIASNLREQTLKPRQFVMVADGELTPELESVIARWQKEATAFESCEFIVVRLEKNQGLAAALNFGLKHCTSSWIARADSDDISLPHRFEQQMNYLRGSDLAVLGSYINEVASDGQTVQALRTAPTEPAEITRAISRRNPVFHPTVMMKKSAIDAVGGYEEVPGAEDYWLWSRLIREGFSIANLPEALVNYRTGGGTYEKRGGVVALVQDIKVQRKLYHGYTVSAPQAARNLAVRAVYRFLPLEQRQKLFRTFFAQSPLSASQTSKEN